MNEPQYSTPLKTFVCRECGLTFDGPRRGSERRTCPQCRPAPAAPRPSAGTCTDCGKTFPPPKRGPIGARCPECKRQHRCDLGNGYYAVRRDERAANPQPVDKTGWIQCPYCPDLMPAWRKKCGKPECNQAYQRDRCRDWLRQYSDEHGIGYAMALNPDKRRESRRNCKARRRGVPGTHTTADERAQYDRQHSRCFYRKVNPECDVSLKDGYHVEHVIPMGGDRPSSNGPENIVLSCSKCNLSKGAKDPMDWAGIMF